MAKLRSLIDEATQAKSEDGDKLVAIQERISYSQRTGNFLDVRSALFNILATPAEIEADKVVRRFEQRSRSSQYFRGPVRPHPFRRPRVDRSGSCYALGIRDISLEIALANEKCNSNAWSCYIILE